MGHVPVLINEREILSFREAYVRAEAGVGGYDRGRWLYVPDFYTEYRYILGTRGEKPLIAVGVNPSTAGPGELDNTLKSVERVSRGNGFDSFIMFNVYAQRATDPDLMDREMNTVLHRENMLAFEFILEKCAGGGGRPAVWAAWGTIIEKRGYLKRCVLDMVELGERYGAEWFICGRRSKAGHPHHPLYLKKGEPLVRFDIAEYAGRLE